MKNLPAMTSSTLLRSPMLALALALAISLGACSGPADTPAKVQPATTTSQEEPALPADGAFVGRVWISTTPGSARGSIIVFLPNRTVLMDSCPGTFRLTQWGASGDRIRWIEDTIPIEAEVTMRGQDILQLHVEGTDRARSYLSADVPYACPDMPN